MPEPSITPSAAYRASVSVGGGLDDALQQRVERELRAERDACVDEDLQPVGERGGFGIEVYSRGRAPQSATTKMPNPRDSEELRGSTGMIQSRPPSGVKRDRQGPIASGSLGPDARPASRRAVHLEDPVEGLHAVLQAAEAGSVRRQRAAPAVVRDLDGQPVVSS